MYGLLSILLFLIKCCLPIPKLRPMPQPRFKLPHTPHLSLMRRFSNPTLTKIYINSLKFSPAAQPRHHPAHPHLASTSPLLPYHHYRYYHYPFPTPHPSPSPASHSRPVASEQQQIPRWPKSTH